MIPPFHLHGHVLSTSYHDIVNCSGLLLMQQPCIMDVHTTNQGNSDSEIITPYHKRRMIFEFVLVAIAQGALY